MNPNEQRQSDIRQALGIEDASGKKSLLKSPVCWGVLILFVSGILIFWNARNTTEVIEYVTGKAVTGDLIMTVSATGNLEPTNQVDVSSELSGIIENVEVDYNDHVEVGQVLARLDTDKLEADVGKYRAALEIADAQVLQAQAMNKEARDGLERLRYVHELSGGKVPAASDLESAEAAFAKAQADLAAAQAQVAQAQAVLESAKTDLAKATIRSPINGIVLSRDAEPGQTVASSLQAPVLFALAEDLAHMELHVDVDEADVGQVRQGQAATFTVDAYPDKVFPACIVQVRYAAQDTDGVVTYETVLSLDNTELLLRPGMTATADITVAAVKDAVLVPNPALRFVSSATKTDRNKKTGKQGGLTSKLLPRRPKRGRKSSNQGSVTAGTGKSRVWILQDGQPVPLTVTTGLTDGIMSEIKSGVIEPGMELVVGVKSASL